MRIFKSLSLVMFALLLSIDSFGQKSIEFPKEINSIKMTAPGVAVVGTDDALYGFDKDGKELWKNEKLKKISETQIEILEGSELLYIASFRGFYLINVLTGELYGQDGGQIYGARVIHATNQVWIIRKYNRVEVYDIATNTKLYELDNVDLPFGLNSSNQTDSQSKDFIGVQPLAYTDDHTAVMHLGLGSVCKYDLSAGKNIWQFDWSPYKVKKPNGDKGDRASDLKRGYGIMKLDNPSNTLYFPFRNILLAIDTETGKAKWDIKANKTGLVKDIYVSDEGIVILTPNGLQLINKVTGAAEWDKPIKIKGSDGGLLINNEGTFYVVSKKSIEKIDIASRTSTTLVEKIKFQGDDSFSGLELLNGVVVLSGSQNVIGVNKESGEILFTTYYKAPGAGFSTIAQNIALATVAMAATYNSYNLNKGLGNKTYYQYTPNTGKYLSNGTTTDAANNIFISTKFKDADAKGFGIASVDKTTGKTKDKIVIGDRDPIYAVDENNGIIFYKSKKEGITIKPLN